jgi:hypothetical protein
MRFLAIWLQNKSLFFTTPGFIVQNAVGCLRHLLHRALEVDHSTVALEVVVVAQGSKLTVSTFSGELHFAIPPNPEFNRSQRLLHKLPFYRCLVDCKVLE